MASVDAVRHIAGSSTKAVARPVEASGIATQMERDPARTSSARKTDADSELDRLTNSRKVGGNKLRLLVDGVQSFPQREANIREADVILVKTYNFRDDATGRRMVALLADKARHGAKVYLQFDVRGFYVKDAEALQRVSQGRASVIPPLLAPLVAAGGVVIPMHAREKPPLKIPETRRWATPLAVLGLLLAAVLNPWWAILPLVNLAYDWLARKANDYLNTTGRRDHEKYLITWKRGDPVKVIMGGMNIGDEWALGGTDRPVPRLGGLRGMRDNDIEGTGPFAEAVLAEYLKDVRHHGIPGAGVAHGTPASALTQLTDALSTIRSPQYRTRAFPWTANGSQVRFVANEPYKGVAGQYIERLLCDAFSKVPTGETVRISVPFFAPTQPVEQAMLAAAQRGVKIRLLLNSPHVGDQGMRWAARGAQELYRTMFDDYPPGTIEIYELHAARRRKDTYSALHQKLYVFGARGPLVVGSSNLDRYSLRWNSEGMLAIDDAKLHAEATQLFERDLTLPGVARAAQPKWTLLTWLAHLFYDLPVRWARETSEAVLGLLAQPDASS